MDPAEPDSDADLGFGSAPPFAFLAPTPSPASRRLSSSFSGSNRPLPPARKRLAYVDLQGRLVGAEEATSAWAIGGLGREEVAAWQLFSPIQRVVLVAVIGVAVAESRKNRLISQLKKSVEVRVSASVAIFVSLHFFYLLLNLKRELALISQPRPKLKRFVQ
ncbi:hypothetical protein CRG98_019404 [Punica granatum]|uniref:Uncharacterized protein n=1 Tax=Punica granatum TaxID=22663 RepID=A0A2I0JXM8_PUNGR|nr:hypothetical protein CRG98_019404 [Punica granatum]